MEKQKNLLFPSDIHVGVLLLDTSQTLGAAKNGYLIVTLILNWNSNYWSLVLVSHLC